MGKTAAQVTVTVDMVIIYNDHILLIERRKWPYEGMWALPGGKLDEGESLEQAAQRELYEETGVQGIALEQAGIYSDPARDPRGRYISVAYVAVLPHEVAAQAGDDAVAADWFPVDHLPALAFDHERIIQDVLASRHHHTATPTRNASTFYHLYLPHMAALSDQEVIDHYQGERLKLQVITDWMREGKPETRPVAYPNTFVMNLYRRELQRRGLPIPHLSPLSENEQKQEERG